MVDQTTPQVKVVLTAPTGVDVERGHAGVEVADLAAEAYVVPDTDVKSAAELKHAGVFTGRTRILAAEYQGVARGEAAKASSHGEPGRNGGVGEEIDSGGGGDEDGFVALRNDIEGVVQIFIEIEHHRDFRRELQESSAAEYVTGVVEAEGQTISRMQDRSRGSGHTLVRNEGASNGSRNFIGALRRCSEGEKGDKDKRRQEPRDSHRSSYQKQALPEYPPEYPLA